MTFELAQSFLFEAAHTLQRTVPLVEFEPSMRVHGHTYTAEVAVTGKRGPSGMLEIPRKGKHGPLVLDLFLLRQRIALVRDMLDHRLLDEVEGLEFPTLECLCEFIANRIDLPVCAVTLSRATGDRCTYRKPR